MPIGLLNPTKIRKLIKAGDDGVYYDGEGLELRLRNSATDQYWSLRYTDPATGKRRKIGLGALHSLPLGAAQEKAAKYREMLLDDKDPHIERANERYEQVRVRSVTKTVNEVIDLFVENTLVGLTTPRYFRNTVDWHLAMVRRSIGEMPIEKVTPLILLEKVGDICVGRGPKYKPIYKTVGMGKLWKMRESGREFQRIVEALFEYAINFEFYHKPNPATQTRLGLKETLHQVQHRKPVSVQNVPLVIDALRTYRYSHFFHKLHKAGVRPPITMAIEFSALAGGVRMGEVRQAQWKEIDPVRKLWTVPAKHRKLKLKYKLNPLYTHEVPLTPGMIAILDQVKADGYDTSREAPIFASMGKDGIFDASTVANFIRNHLQPYIRKAYGVDIVFHAHGFRSSLRDWWRAKGHPGALWKLQVGQRPGGRDDLDDRSLVKNEVDKSDNAYGHEQLTEERRPHMMKWDALCSSYTPTPASKTAPASKPVADFVSYRKKRRAA
jgi:integrase